MAGFIVVRDNATLETHNHRHPFEKFSGSMSKRHLSGACANFRTQQEVYKAARGGHGSNDIGTAGVAR
jgi:hypothetical protein